MFQRTNGKLMLSDATYNLGKKLVQVYTPAISALYFGLGNIWGFPSIENVVGTFAVLSTFIGVCLGLSSKQYDSSGAAHDGELVLETTKTGKTVYTLALDGDPDDLKNKDSISFKVAKKA